jgi:AcrR family transcriptional regulator
MAERGTSNYRQLQAQMTRDRIVAAARQLMTERGWAGATVEAIAKGAGVATPTVYAAFGNKRSILTGMREAMVRDAKIAELMEEAAAEPRARRRLGLWATLVRQQMETSYDVIAIHREAARSDPDVARSYRRVLDNRAKVFSEFVEGLREELAPGVDVGTATDLLWALSTEGLWQELTVERGWSPERFERWLAGTLVHQMLGT